MAVKIGEINIDAIKISEINIGSIKFGEINIPIGGDASDFVGVYRTTSANESAKITVIGFTQDVIVDYGDGSPLDTISAGNGINHTYATAGDHTVKIQFLAPITDFTNAWFDCGQLIEVISWNSSFGTIFQSTFYGCSELEKFTSLDFSSLIDGGGAFSGCLALLQPPATGTSVRDGTKATQGTWTKP